MLRRIFFKHIISLFIGFFSVKSLRSYSATLYGNEKKQKIKSHKLGKTFTWGVATAAFQTEGAVDVDGKTPSVWDHFVHHSRRFRQDEHADVAVDFYYRYQHDIDLIKDMNLDAFRFSLAWTRIMPQGTGKVNQKGLDFYHRVIDACLEKGIEPWLTLYHWDLPQSLEEDGGWTNRQVVDWFSEFTDTCTRAFGDKVHNWLVLNEPMSFTGLGYFMGYHAPGRRGLRNFLPAAHHAALAQAAGGRLARANIPHANIGTTLSCSYIDPVNDKEMNRKAAQRLDAVMNRLFLEPALGLGYPSDVLDIKKHMEPYFQPGDEEAMAFDFDFIGLQYYFRTVARFSLFPPVLFARDVPAPKRNVPMNNMGFEPYPKGLYKMLKQFASYPQMKKIIVTETGICLDDTLGNGGVHDTARINFLKDTIKYVRKAQKNNIPVEGYFVWTLTDNFEWSEGYHPRFGLVYVDFATQQRYLKDSALWLTNFLSKK